MRISIFGLGYVGSVLAACLAEGGHEVVGVDLNPRKVEAINEGQSPVEEAGVEERLADGAAEGRVRATTDASAAVLDTELSVLTVGTPPDDSGRLSTTNLYNVLDSAFPALAEKSEHTFVVRSTVPPGTTRNLRAYVAEEFDGGTDVDLLVNPEFLREGSAIADFHDPPYVVVGAFDPGDAESLTSLYGSLEVDAEVSVVEPELAESLKLVNNAFHALKICFANEVGSVASALDVDGRQLMELVCADTKLNVSPTYLDPGFAFGGACLPKDSQALATLGAEADVSIPVLDTITESNDTHLERVRAVVDGLDADRVGVAGISFKSDTVDFRNSPGLRLARSLESEWTLYASDLDLHEVVGANRDYLDRAVPEEDRFVSDPEEFLDRVDAVVFANDGDFPELFPAITEKTVVDPVGTLRDRRAEIPNYRRVSW
jgi:GDP-mannose 6-dehydrogenase